MQLKYGLKVLLLHSGEPACRRRILLSVVMARLSGFRVNKVQYFVGANVLLRWGCPVLLSSVIPNSCSSMVLNIGDLNNRFMGLTLNPLRLTARRVDEQRTLFFGLWVAWRVVGLFLARISRDRTIRQFVLVAYHRSCSPAVVASSETPRCTDSARQWIRLPK